MRCAAPVIVVWLRVCGHFQFYVIHAFSNTDYNIQSGYQLLYKYDVQRIQL